MSWKQKAQRAQRALDVREDQMMAMIQGRPWMTTERRSRKRQCEGKKRMKEHEAVSSRERLAMLGRTMDLYRCPHCGTWHLGHRDQSIDRSLIRDEIGTYDYLSQQSGQRIGRLRRRR